jgi:predicted dienelactone hydrolase
VKRFAAMILLTCVASASAEAAGVREIEVTAGANGPSIQALIWTPCAEPSRDVRLLNGRVVLPGVRDCAISGGKLPLIVISHGGGGDFTGHRDTAETLADAGFIVVALNHPRDSGRLDMTRANVMAALIERPTDVKRLVDYMLQSSPVAAKIDSDRIGFFGFSRGGYTGLVLAGAVAEYPSDVAARPPGYDARFKAFAIVDPLTLAFFPTKDNFQRVVAPLQLWSSQNGGQGVTPEKVAAVANDLPQRPDFHLVPNSTHLSFLMPCPPAVAKVAGEVCVDPPGFDRAAFHDQFNAQVLAFFRRNVTP